MHSKTLWQWLFFTCFFAFNAFPSESSPNDPEFDEILAQDLSNLTVTSVAKRSQRLKDTAAAVYVITQEELRRAGIYSIPDALRLVPGMQVAKTRSDRWAISSRGFTGELSNKLLVLIDGRAIYTPVFSGVYWGDQSTTINDIDRIEVIRGPGASLYGANAVNGVVNVITKPAQETQGNLTSATATSAGNGLYEARHGGQLNNNVFYRAYGQYLDSDTWYRGRSGFRIDSKNLNRDKVTFQGDVYSGEQDERLDTPTITSPYLQTVYSSNQSYGGNVLGRWTRELEAGAEMSLQAYVDHYSRLESNFGQHVSTADVQLQHSFALNDHNQFIWGAGARLIYQNLDDTFSAQVNDEYNTHEIFNTFAQNEYALLPEILYLTIGSKFEYNDFTGLEVQPTGRLTWHPSKNQTVWGSVSRAIRTPSIYEEDISLLAIVSPGAQGSLTESRVLGNPEQQSEELIAYEIGHRIQPTRSLSFDTALFLNDYDKIQTIGSAGTLFIGENGNTIIPYTFNNLGSGQTYGAEFAVNYNVTNDWRLAGSYTYLRMDLKTEPGVAVGLDSAEKLEPRNRFAIQSYYNITSSLQWDNMVYYVDNISSVDSYVRYDSRLAWLIHPGLEVSLIGRNLVDSHKEFNSTYSSKIGRSYIGQLLWKF